MIDLTPLDVRKKRGDFRRLMRGYDPSEVDTFLDLVAERLEELVKENLTLRERSDRLQEQVSALSDRERAVNEALVTAQELRGEIKEQALREADLLKKEAESDARQIVGEAERRIEERRASLAELERRRLRFLGAFRQLLERELDAVAVEEGRGPPDEAPVDLELRGGRGGRGSVKAPGRSGVAMDDEGPEVDPAAVPGETSGDGSPEAEGARAATGVERWLEVEEERDGGDR